MSSHRRDPPVHIVDNSLIFSAVPHTDFYIIGMITVSTRPMGDEVICQQTKQRDKHKSAAETAMRGTIQCDFLQLNPELGILQAPCIPHMNEYWDWDWVEFEDARKFQALLKIC